MNWQHIAHLDPYLAGNIAARTWDWYNETSGEREADSVNLTDEKRTLFLQAWNEEIATRDKERRETFILCPDHEKHGFMRNRNLITKTRKHKGKQ